jgi:hypothetical protein
MGLTSAPMLSAVGTSSRISSSRFGAMPMTPTDFGRFMVEYAEKWGKLHFARFREIRRTRSGRQERSQTQRPGD